MAEEQKTFVFYKEWIEWLNKLDEGTRLRWYDAIMNYAYDGTLPDFSPMEMFTFEPYKAAIDRNNNKYETIKQKRSDAGKKGNEKRWNKSQNIANIANATDATKESQNIANVASVADNVNDNVDVNVNDNDNVNVPLIMGGENISHTHAKETFNKKSFIPDLRGNQSWIEAICMQHKITPPEVQEWLGRFELDNQCSGVQHTSIRDAQSHFNSWLKKEIANDKRNNKQGSGVCSQEERHLRQLREIAEIAGGNPEHYAILEATYKNRF